MVGKFNKLMIRDVPLDGKTVLVRCDYNVPLETDGTIADDFRITASLPTLRQLIKRGCKVVIISHMGRPKGREEKYSLRQVAEHLSGLLSREVTFVDDSKGDKVKIAVKKSNKNSVILLENLRFYEQEEANDNEFAEEIVKCTGARYFIQDGFGVVHRAHASTEAITNYLPSVAGLLLENEVKKIRGVMESPAHPLLAIMGGAKVSDKIAVIEALEPIAEKILIGGAMANTFLEARSISVGKSKCETDQDEEVEKIYSLAEKKIGSRNTNEFIVLPTDVAVAQSVESHTRKNVPVNAIPDDLMALDIGDNTIEAYVKAIEQSKTVIWNGTLGFAENDTFAHGSARIAMALATHPNIVSVVGGGDTADFVRNWDSKNGDSFTHVSTGGGASLDLMAGKTLPGVAALLDGPRRN